MQLLDVVISLLFYCLAFAILQDASGRFSLPKHLARSSTSDSVRIDSDVSVSEGLDISDLKGMHFFLHAVIYMCTSVRLEERIVTILQFEIYQASYLLSVPGVPIPVMIVGIEEETEEDHDEAVVLDSSEPEVGGGRSETDFSITDAFRKIGRGTVGSVSKAIKGVSSSLRRKEYVSNNVTANLYRKEGSRESTQLHKVVWRPCVD